MKAATKWVLSPVALASIVVAILGWMTWIPRPAAGELQTLVSRFSFQRLALPHPSREVTGPGGSVFAEPLKHIDGWLSVFLPTGAALFDADGLGRPDAVCVTDPYSREIWIRSLPGKPHPFSDFRLDLGELNYNAAGTVPTGCLPGDFSESGRMDLLVYFWGRTPVIFVRNDDDGKPLSSASFHAQEVVEGRKRWYTQSITQADVTGSGHLDLIVANYFPDDAKVFDDGIPGTAIMNKGWGSAYNGSYNRLLLKDASDPKAARFIEASGAFGDDLGGTQWSLVPAAVDFDGDQLPEIIFLNDHGPDRFLHNRSKPGEPKFALIENRRDLMTPKSKTLGQDAFHGMGIDFADLDQRGLLDWGVSNFGADYLFHQSHFAWINTGDSAVLKEGRAPFVDRSEDLGLARTRAIPWDYRMEDFDNSGSIQIWQSEGLMRGEISRVPEMHEMALQNDLLMQFPFFWHHFTRQDDLVGNEPNAFFVRRANGRYVDIGPELGMMEAGLSRGTSTADVDGDGLVDMVVTNQHAAPTFFHNQAPKPGQFLGLNVRLPYTPLDPERIVVRSGLNPPQSGPKSRPAIGASLVVSLPNGRKVASFVDGGNGAGGKRPPFVHLGLGDLPKDATLEVNVSWRDTKGQTHRASTHVTPGWHTIWLGSSPELAEVRK